MFSDLVLQYKDSSQASSNIFEQTNSFFRTKYQPGKSAEYNISSGFIPGEIYLFSYATDSKVSKDRPFIDKMPLVLCISVYNNKKIGKILHGIDLVVVPPIDRIEILGKIWDSFPGDMKKNQEAFEKKEERSPLNFNPDFFSSAFGNTGFKKAIFGFKFNSIRIPRVIDCRDWPKIPYYTLSAIEGTPIGAIYKEYKSKI